MLLISSKVKITQGKIIFCRLTFHRITPEMKVRRRSIMGYAAIIAVSVSVSRSTTKGTFNINTRTDTRHIPNAIINRNTSNLFT
jgi:hypothetical protein